MFKLKLAIPDHRNGLFVYSARADFQSAPAHPIYTVPGFIFLSTVLHDLVNVPMA